jgi:hypothetical protein
MHQSGATLCASPDVTHCHAAVPCISSQRQLQPKRVETFGHLVRAVILPGKSIEHLRPALLSGLTLIEQMQPVAEPLTHQRLGHFRVTLQGEDFLAPAERLMFTPGATQ